MMSLFLYSIVKGELAKHGGGKTRQHGEKCCTACIQLRPCTAELVLSDWTRAAFALGIVAIACPVRNTPACLKVTMHYSITQAHVST